MADTKYFDKVKLLDGTYAEVYDKVAREAIKGGTHFLGVTTTTLSDGANADTVMIGTESKTVANGDIVVFGNKEFIYADSDKKWHELGDTTGLGALALKDSVSASYKPEGSISKPGVTVTPTKANIKEFATEGTVQEGTPNTPTQVTLPSLSTQLNGTTLEFVWTDGSVVEGSAGVPTKVTLPTTKSTSVLTGASAALDATPTFTGKQATIVSQ